MALIKADRVKEISTSETTANFILGGAATGYRTFSSVCAVGDTFYYAISNQSNGEWEVGLGTYGVPNILERTTVHASSNAGNKVNFSSGTKECFISATKAWLDTFVTQTSGTTNYVAKATGTGTIGNSQIFDNGTSVGIGTNSPFSYAKIQCVISAAGNWPFYSQGTTGNFGAGFYIDGNNAGQMYVADGTGAYKAQISSTGSSYVTNSFGIGTSSPDIWGTGLTIYKSANNSIGLTVINPSATSSASSTITLGSAVTGGAYGIISRNNSYFTGSGLYDSPNTLYIDSNYNNLQLGSYASYAIKLFTNNTQRAIVSAAGLVGINETSPGAQLQVTTAAAATKGLIVKGASGQSANLQEWQDNNGNVVAAVYSNGGAVFGAQTGAQTSYVVRAWSAPSSALDGQILTSLTGATGANERFRMSIGNTSSYGFLQTYENAIGYTMSLALQPSGGNVGIGTTSPVAKLQLGTGTDVMANAGGLTVVGGGLVLDGAGTYADRELYFRYTSTVATISSDQALRFRTSNGAAPAERMRIDASGNVGIGTTSANSKLHLQDGNLTIKGTTNQFIQLWNNSTVAANIGGNINFRGTYRNSDLDSVFYAQIFGGKENANDQDYAGYISFSTYQFPGSLTERMRITSTGNVGIGTTSPDSKLHAVGNIKAKFTTYHLSLTGDLPGYTAGAIPTLKSDATKIWFSSNNNAIGAWGTDTAFQGIELYAVGSGTGARINTNPSGVSYIADGNVGIGTTSPTGQLHTQSAAAATKALVVRGASGQSANLQEWQNNSGTALASVSSAGSFNCSGFSTNEGAIADGNTPNLYRIGDYYYCRFTRDLPITAGSYVELFEISDSYTSRIEMQAWSYQHGVESTFRTYDSSLSLNYSTNGIFQPTSHIGANSWEIEKVFIAPTVCRIRIRRTKTVTASPAPYAIVDIRFKAVSGASDIKSYSGTGTSSVGNNYLPSGTVSQGTITPTPPVGDSGNGRDLSIVGGTAAGTGNGGSILLQAGAYSTSGSNGKVIVRGLASNTANLQEWQNNAGTALASVDSAGQIVSTGALIINQSPSVPTLRVRSGNPSTTNIQEWQNYYGTVLSRVDANGNIVAPEVSTSNLNTYQWFAGSTYVFSRIFTKNGNLPSVVGNYVELFECTNSRSLPIRIAINANDPHQGKVYDFVFGPAYYGGAGSGSIIPPLYSANADSSNDFELEVYHVDPYLSRFRLRRTAGTSNRAFQAYINVQVGNTGTNFTSLSGTGTSTLGSTENPGYGISTHYIKPVHASTYTGNGRDLTLVGASGQGTGNGGNIILQAGAYSTSGSNGKVIVRGLASNTANLQEWQNNAGTALARVTSSGRFSNPNGFGQAEQFGNGATASSEYATAFGFNATGAGSLCTAVGWNVTANGVGGVAVGASTSTSNHYKPVAIGAGSSTGADRAIVIGGDSYAGGGYSIAIGSAVAANGTGSINIGFNSTVSANNVTSIGGTYTTDTYLYGTVTTTLGTATQKGFVVKAASGQSANLLELQNNSGTALATIDSAGRIGVGAAPQAGYSLYGTGSIYAGGGGVLVAGNAGLFYLNGRVGIGTGTGTPVFGCEYTNYMRPIILSGYPDGAGYIGTIINTSSTYANATAKLLSVQNNGTEKFAVFSDGSMAGVDARLTGSIQITSNTPSAFTVDQNDLALSASGFQRLSGTAARNITGIAPPSGSHVDGRMMRIYNVGSYNLTLKHNSTASSAPNRFFNVQSIDIIIGPNDYAELIYDGTNNGSGAAGWRVA